MHFDSLHCRLLSAVRGPRPPNYHHLGMVSGSWLPSLAQPDAAYTAYLPHGSHRQPLRSEMQPLCSQMQPLSSHKQPQGSRMQPLRSQRSPWATICGPYAIKCSLVASHYRSEGLARTRLFHPWGCEPEGGVVRLRRSVSHVVGHGHLLTSGWVPSGLVGARRRPVWVRILVVPQYGSIESSVRARQVPLGHIGHIGQSSVRSRNIKFGPKWVENRPFGPKQRPNESYRLSGPIRTTPE